MFWNTDRTDSTTAILLDISSGSVGGSIVSVDHVTNKQTQVFSVRHYFVGQETEGANTIRAVKEALLAVMLELSSTGVKAMTETNPQERISKMYIMISAPWAHTVSRNIEYNTEEPVKINEELLKELSATAEEQAYAVLQEDSIAEIQNLSVIHRATTALSANGYPITPKATITTDKLTLTHTSSLVDSTLLTTAQEITEPVFPEVEVEVFTTAFVQYQVFANLSATAQNACLVNISGDATEIAVVKDGTLSYVTHMPIGARTIARKVSAVGNIPITEAFTYLKADEGTALSDAVGEQIESSAVAYMKAVATLLVKEGDHFTIPETIYLHTGSRTESFFANLIKSAVEKVTHGTHSVHPVSTTLLTKLQEEDSALHILSLFFHTQEAAGYDT